jgi:putative GTP pyrophosphokinase
MDVENAVEEYRRDFPIYEVFTQKVSNLIKDLLKNSKINASVEMRTKDVDSFFKKIQQEDKSYTFPLKEVTDLCGVRIILQRLSDIDKVTALVYSEFDVDEANSVSKASLLAIDQFGYNSPHIVVRLNEERRKWLEWKDYSELKAEIQVRTILQHAWSVLSRNSDYRQDADIPKGIRRNLYALAALFELADEEIERIADKTNKILIEYKRDLKTALRDLELNVDSLRTFIENDDIANYWVSYFKENINVEVVSWSDLSRDIRILKYCNINNLDELKTMLINAQGWGELFLKEYYDEYFKRTRAKPNYVTVVINGVIMQLIIATFYDMFTSEILSKEFGFETNYILDIAKRTKGQKTLPTSK